MKKYFSAIALGLSILALASCGGGNNPETTTTDTAESGVVVSGLFPPPQDASASIDRPSAIALKYFFI